MGSQKAKRHTHKYRLVPMGSTRVWSCALPDCNHYMPPNMAQMVEGKASECWECAKTTTMIPDRMKFAIENNEGRMLCQDCINKRKGLYAETEDDVPSIDDVIAQMSRSIKS